MGYPAKLLTQGESIEFETRPHWRSMIFPSIVLLVTVAVAGFLLATIGSGTVQGWARWAVIVVALVVIVLWFVRPLLTWLTTQYVFTSRRIITRTGIIARSGKDMPLSKVNDVSFRYTIIERVLGCGTLTVSSASEDGELEIRNVPKVEEIQREIYRLAEADAQRRGSGS
jgi:membrane protein YdbS with pleckstrin-like domain